MFVILCIICCLIGLSRMVLMIYKGKMKLINGADFMIGFGPISALMMWLMYEANFNNIYFKYATAFSMYFVFITSMLINDIAVERLKKEKRKKKKTILVSNKE